jgi:hypothetical protein
MRKRLTSANGEPWLAEPGLKRLIGGQKVAAVMPQGGRCGGLPAAEIIGVQLEAQTLPLQWMTKCWPEGGPQSG